MQEAIASSVTHVLILGHANLFKLPVSIASERVVGTEATLPLVQHFLRWTQSS